MMIARRFDHRSTLCCPTVHSSDDICKTQLTLLFLTGYDPNHITEYKSSPA